jgi:hypothetical protein
MKTRRHQFCCGLVFLVLALPFNQAELSLWTWMKKEVDQENKKELKTQEFQPYMKMKVGDFDGSTGQSMREQILLELKRYTQWELVEGRGAYECGIRGTSNGGRLEFILTDDKGKKVGERTYAYAGITLNARQAVAELHQHIFGIQTITNTQLIVKRKEKDGFYLFMMNGLGEEEVRLIPSRLKWATLNRKMDRWLGIIEEKNRCTMIDQNIKTGKEQLISQGYGNSYVPTLSPDGTQAVAAMSFGGMPSWYLIEMSTLQAKLLPVENWIPQAASWSVEGKDLYLSQRRGSCWRILKLNLLATDKIKITTWKNDAAGIVECSTINQKAWFKMKGNDFQEIMVEGQNGIKSVQEVNGGHDLVWCPNPRFLGFHQGSYFCVIDLNYGKVIRKIDLGLEGQVMAWTNS